MPAFRYRFPDRGALTFAANADVLVAASVDVDRGLHHLTRRKRTTLHVYHKARGCLSDPLELPQLQRSSAVHFLAFVKPRLLLAITSSEHAEESQQSFHAHLLRASDACESFSHGSSRLLISSSETARMVACGLYDTTSQLWFVLLDEPGYNSVYDVNDVLDEKAEVRLKVPPFSFVISTRIRRCMPYGNFLYMLCRSDAGMFSTELLVLHFANGNIMRLPEFRSETGNRFCSTRSKIRFDFFKNRLYGILLNENCVRSAVFDLERRVWTTSSETLSLCMAPSVFYQFYKLVILPSGEALVETKTTSRLDSSNRYVVSTFIEPPTLLDLAYRIIHTRLPFETKRLLGKSDVAKPHDLVNALLGGLSMSRKRTFSDTSE